MPSRLWNQDISGLTLSAGTALNDGSAMVLDQNEVRRPLAHELEVAAGYPSGFTHALAKGVKEPEQQQSIRTAAIISAPPTGAISFLLSSFFAGAQNSTPLGILDDRVKLFGHN